MTVILTVKPFRKGALRQDELQELMTDIVLLGQAANFMELNIALVLLQNALSKFQMMIHPVVGSEITPEIADLDDARDKYYSGLYFYTEYAVRHYDPAIAAAGRKIQNILNMASYASLQREAYRSETGKIVNLLEELNHSCADAVATLNLGPFLQVLESANLAFRAKYESRNQTEALYYTTAQIRAARTELEKAFDMFKMQLNMLAQIHGEETINPAGGTTGGGTGSGMTGGTGGGMTGGMGGTGTGTGTMESTHVSTNYIELITYVNDAIDRSMAAAKHRLTMGQSDDEGTENPENPTNNNGSDNNGENGGEENTNTDNGGFGDENTPSANA